MYLILVVLLQREVGVQLAAVSHTYILVVCVLVRWTTDKRGVLPDSTPGTPLPASTKVPNLMK